MNIITFNDVFERAVITRHDAKTYDQWCKSPLFVHTLVFRDVVKKFQKDGVGPTTEVPWLPFKMFRLNLNVAYGGVFGVPNYPGIVWRVQDKLLVRALGNGKWEVFHYCLNDLKKLRQFTGLSHLPAEYCVSHAEFEPNAEGAIGITVGLYSNELSRWIPLRNHFPNESGQAKHEFDVCNVTGQVMTEDDFTKSMIQQRTLLLGFAIDAMAPTNRIATVVPAQSDHRSVQWTQARTHYTIITHDHPANSRDVVHGERVKVDEGKELTRMAHNRRAHEKLLRHPRYRFMRGQKIKVKACWVGPKEWKDEGGKQIYKILELASEEL